jgi:hypothetical protein
LNLTARSSVPYDQGLVTRRRRKRFVAADAVSVTVTLATPAVTGVSEYGAGPSQPKGGILEWAAPETHENMSNN